MLSVEVTAEDCAPHPDGMTGRCRFCGSPEGSDHAPDCQVFSRNPLRDAASPQEPADAPEVPAEEVAPPGPADAVTDAETGPPAILSEADVKVLVPSLTAKIRMVILGERIYLRDGEEFKLLGSGPDLDLLHGAQLKLAERTFLEAACDYWRQVDRITGTTSSDPLTEQLGGLGQLREAEQAAWECYRELLG